MTTEHIFIRKFENPFGSLYYYQGNFYYPMDMPHSQLVEVKQLIRKFIKENKKLVENDRKDPNYRNLVQIFDTYYGKK